MFDQTIFVYDRGRVALQFNKTGSGNLAADDLSHRYLWGPAVDELLADEQVDWSDSDADGEVLWALTDHLGSVRDVVDSNGDLRIHRRFDAFGNIVDETHYNVSGAEATPGQAGYVDEAFAFTGRLFDKTTGLQNNLNRWYDPQFGRWTSEDPIGFAAGDANLYRYVGNEPTGWIDPSGLAPGDAQWGVRQRMPPNPILQLPLSPQRPVSDTPDKSLKPEGNYIINWNRDRSRPNEGAGPAPPPPSKPPQKLTTGGPLNNPYYGGSPESPPGSAGGRPNYPPGPWNNPRPTNAWYTPTPGYNWFRPTPGQEWNGPRK